MITMKRKWFGLSAGLIILLMAFLIPGAMAATAAAPGYIVVGLAPSADFDAYYAYNAIPTKVIFHDNSFGTPPLKYLWDFGDGSTSTEQNPTHMYIQRGTYTVKLVVTNAFGQSTEIKENYITVGRAPIAVFSANPTSGSVPLVVMFTDQSLGQVTSWTWDFGDGKGSTEKSPVHTYWTSGIYTVTLTVSNDYGTSDTRKTNYITAIPELVSKFTADPMSGKAPLTVKFTDRSTGNPSLWKWEFGDGTTSTEQNPTHTFTTTGAFDVKLQVARGDESDTSTNVIDVGGVPIADFVGAPLSVNIGNPVRFNDKTTNAPTSWIWDFGDGATSTDRNPLHIYQAKGIYTVSLTARNNNGKDTETKLKYINAGMGPVADFVALAPDYEKYRVPQSVRFIDMSANSPTSWYWDFGDGQNSPVQSPKHVYMKEGTYSVSLTVKNDFGTDTKVIKGIITVGGGPKVDFTSDRQVVGVMRFVQFKDLSANSPVEWSWDFGDGTTGSGQNPDHRYREAGVYSVTLTASNLYTTNSVTKKNYITVLDIPTANFVADKTRGAAPMDVQFTDKSTGNPTTWTWDFGDGSVASTQNPKHTYTKYGTYSVVLTVSNANGQDTETKMNYIVTTQAPVADFRVDKRIGKAPFTVQFRDLSKNDPNRWFWEFGDGATSVEQNPTHVYAYEGAYDVRLTVWNNYGSDSIFKTGTTAAIESTVVPASVAAQPPAPVVTTDAPTATPITTEAPLSLFTPLAASLIGLLAVLAKIRK